MGGQAPEEKLIQTQDLDTCPGVAKQLKHGRDWWLQNSQLRLVPTDPVLCQVVQDTATGSLHLAHPAAAAVRRHLKPLNPCSSWVAPGTELSTAHLG